MLSEVTAIDRVTGPADWSQAMDALPASIPTWSFSI